MRKCKFLIVSLLLLVIFTPQALCQKSFIDGKTITQRKEKGKNKTVTDNTEAVLSKGKGKSNINPNVRPKLYRNVYKKFGRWVGVGKEVPASEMTNYAQLYRLSEQNMAGFWTKMEAIDFNGEFTTNHSMGTYVMNQLDDGDSVANEEWRDKLKTICQWSMIFDETGENVVQERAYDGTGNLVYTYTPMKVSNCESVGTYANCWGIPVNLRGENGASLVKIKWDDKGNEIEYVFVDEKGRLMRNQNGVYINKFSYDSCGNQIENLSCDEFGTPVIDNCGNCGWKSKYDANYNQVWSCFIDEKMQLIKMPMTTRNANSDNIGVAITRYKHDQKWGRMVEQSFYNEYDRPDTNAWGVHKYTLEYDMHGNIIWIKCHGTDGKICGNGSWNGAGMLHKRYDKWGNVDMMEFFGKDTTERINVGQDNDWCKWESHFIDKEGNKDRHYSYIMIDGKMVRYYSYEKNGQKAITIFSDTTSRIDSFDITGYKVLEMHLDKEGKPYEPFGYHKIVSSKNKKDGKTIEIEKWYGMDGKLSNNMKWAIEETETDSINRTIRTKKSLANGMMYEHYILYCNDKWQRIRQESLNKFGVKARTERENSVYLAETKLSFDGNISDIYARNEFGELTYLHDWKSIYCHTHEIGDSTVYYDENEEEITESAKSFKNRLPIALVVEVSDSVGYANGLKDGDVILQYGYWHYTTTDPDSIVALYEGDFYTALIAESPNAKTIRVLRHHVDEKRSEIVTIKLNPGRTDELGFNVHLIYYTANEYRRMQRELNSFVVSHRLENEWKVNTGDGDPLVCLVPEYNKNLSTQLFYKRNVSSPSIILACERYMQDENINDAPSTGSQWIIGMDTESLDAIIWNKDDSKCTKVIIYVTRDLQTIDTLRFEIDDLERFRTRTIANEDFYLVKSSEDTEAKISELKERVLNGAYGFKKSKTEKALNYFTLAEILENPAVENAETIELDEGYTAYTDILRYAELDKETVSGFVVFYPKRNGLRLLHRIKAAMEGFDVVYEIVEGCLIYEYFSSTGQSIVSMVRLDGDFATVISGSFGKSQFNARRFVHSFDKYFGEPSIEELSFVSVTQEEKTTDKSKKLNGEYLVLEFNGWNMYESEGVFVDNLKISIDEERQLVIAPIKRDKDGNIVKIGKPELRVFSGKIGWHFTVSSNLNGFEKVSEVYEKWKKDL